MSFLLNVWAYRRGAAKMSIKTVHELNVLIYGLELAITTLVTTLVVARLLYVRRRHIKLMGRDRMILYGAENRLTLTVQENQTLLINI